MSIILFFNQYSQMASSDSIQTQYMYQCHRLAGYLSNTDPTAGIFVGILSAILTVYLTVLLRNLGTEALALFNPPEPTSAATTGTNAAPATTSPDSPSETSIPDPPPPYDPESQTPQAASSPPPAPKDAEWRAQTFALSTVYLSLSTLGLTTLGFAVQNAYYCPAVEFADYPVTFWKCVVWFVYGLIALFASSGLVAWVIKFLALWGPTTEVGRGKVRGVKIDVDCFAFLLTCVVLLVPMGVWVGCVGLILRSQRWCCPGASDEYAEVDGEDVEMGDRGVRAEDGLCEDTGGK